MALATRWLGRLLLTAAFAIGAIMIVPALLGYERYVITTGSMTGTYDAGSLVIDRPTKVADLRVGDTITYVPPASAGLAGRVTHRIHDIERGTRGELSIRTKGDANRVVDSWRFTPRGEELPKVVVGIPYIGHVYAQLTTQRGRIVAIALPALFIMFSVLAGLWREAGEAARREEEAKAAAAAPPAPVAVPVVPPVPAAPPRTTVGPGSPTALAAGAIPSREVHA